MRVEVNVPEPVIEPRMWVKYQPVLAMALRPGSAEWGLRRSEMTRFTFGAGEMSLVPRHFEKWFRTDDLHYILRNLVPATKPKASSRLACKPAKSR